jgi:hypothetical protein
VIVLPALAFHPEKGDCTQRMNVPHQSTMEAFQCLQKTKMCVILHYQLHQNLQLVAAKLTMQWTELLLCGVSVESLAVEEKLVVFDGFWLLLNPTVNS